ncbi:P-type ATPase [Coccidioides immitis RMSCC 3703]|uniref:P-type ATPase n=1 Tax=Coccidioides immitis RMSCC 3703 TaxID=454286 RepID=A0A0J8QXS0_COCIT|nr:P-type ATPase [Coccidioides immitis RMSCC 3703]
MDSTQILAVYARWLLSVGYMLLYDIPTLPAGSKRDRNGLDLNDRMRMGIFVGCSAVVASNVYILLNTYRWDWLTVLINAISSLLIWFWTGVYSSVLASGQFYKSGAEVFGSLSFWALTLLTVTICLAPRFAIKSFQKIYFPRDVDIIREQVIMGRFKHLENFEAYVPPTARAPSFPDSDLGKPVEVTPNKGTTDIPEDERPIYPPSVAPTAHTHNPRSQNGSDGTGYTASLDFRHQPQHSLDRNTRQSLDFRHYPRHSIDRTRQSFEQGRSSMERARSSFEASNDFTSAAMLAHMIAKGTSRYPNIETRRSYILLYMLDGFYQSVICFYMTYLLYQPAQNVTENGLDLNDRMRMGIFVGCSAVVASNVYILLNTYRWDWLTVLINAISSLLIWFWTGVYSSVLASGQFYKSGAEVFGSLSFWALTLLTVTICLAPRFAIKSFQKIYFPRDVDIIREQVIMGRFKHLENFEAYVPPTARAPSFPDSDLGKPVEVTPNKGTTDIPEDERPIYPPSVAPTAHTHNPRSQNGSDGTGYTASLDFRHQPQHSLDRNTRQSLDFRHYPRHSIDRTRQSFEQGRSSMERARSSFEASNDFTSAAMLARMESTHGRYDPQGHKSIPEH